MPAIGAKAAAILLALAAVSSNTKLEPYLSGSRARMRNSSLRFRGRLWLIGYSSLIQGLALRTSGGLCTHLSTRKWCRTLRIAPIRRPLLGGSYLEERDRPPSITVSRSRIEASEFETDTGRCSTTLSGSPSGQTMRVDLMPQLTIGQ